MSASPWQCSICGQWVMNGFHTCGVSAQTLSQQPLSIPIPQCRAPFAPLTIDAIRLVIREELERIEQQRSAHSATCSGEKP